MALFFLALIPIALGHPVDSFAHAPARPMQAVPVQSTTPTIDGLLDDEIWTRAPVFTGFVQRDPDEGQPATQTTTVQLAYDDEALYLGIVAFDRDPDHIVARPSRRDQRSESDWLQLTLDAHHDHQTARFFEINAAGSLQDGVISSDGDGRGSWDDTWDGVWDARQARHAQGWSVEFKIPYHVLRFSPAQDYTWGINITRYISHRKERVYWAMVPRAENGWVSRFAHLQGLSGIAPSRALELVPYSLGRTSFGQNDEGLLGNLGGSLRLGLSSSLSLNAAINPDFGQVEADPAELNLSVFESFQRERRPFFVEGGQLFNTPIQLFYSRRIGRQPGYRELPDDHELVEKPTSTTILTALKLTGKTAGKTSFGLLHALTTQEHARIESPAGQYRDFLIEPRGNFLVGRVAQDLFSGNSRIGLMATLLNRKGEGPGAYSGGLDWTLKWAENAYNFSGQIALSRAGDPGERTWGGAADMELSKRGGRFRTELDLELFSPEFQINDLGFQRRNDYYRPRFWLQWRDEEPGDLVRRHFVNFNRWARWNFDQVKLDDGVNLNTWHQFSNYWWLGGEFTHDFRTRDDLDTRGGPLIIQPASSEYEIIVESDDRGALSGWAWFEWGSDNAGSTWRGTGAGLTLRPTPRLEIGLRPRYEWNLNRAQWLENADTDGDGEDDRFLYGQLDSKTLDLTTRASFLFNRDLSLEFYIQPFISTGDYSAFKELARPNSYDFTPAQGPQDNPDFRRRSLQSNLVLRWEYRPGSTLFLVWSQARDAESVRPRFRPLADVGNSFADAGTDIILVKYTYWLGL
ncbi:MAG: hypothetical protein GKR89_22855 [Candidatus Latescibacteria bacterium]|nr:hypothetical protein [Candidatus Latescibacterota bacterium]